MRTIIIGDVHGCNQALEKLLEMVRPDPSREYLVFLGDLFDRGPESRDVLLTVKRLASDFGERFVLLRGNHEDYLLQPHLTHWQRIVWERVGRQATVESFRRAGEKMEDAIPWIQANTRLFWKTDGFQCVHAGVKVEPLEANDLNTLVHDHGIVPENRYPGRLTITGHIALEEVMWFAGDGEKTAVLKEDKRYQLPECGVICIDTGCGKGGKLTAMIIEGNHFTLHSVREGKTDG